MDVSQIADLRPTGNSSSEIKRSLEKIKAARSAAAETVRKAEAARKTAMMTGSTRDVRAAETALADARLDAERLGLLEDEIRPMLAAAQERERQAEAAFSAQRDQLAERLAKHEAVWNAQYPKLRIKIQDLLQERREIWDAISEHNSRARGHGEFLLDAGHLAAEINGVHFPPTAEDLAAVRESQEQERQARLEYSLERRAQPKQPMIEPRQPTVNGKVLSAGMHSPY